MYFCYFVIISPWKRAGAFIWTNLNLLHPRMLCAKFGWNWPSGSGEEDLFFKFVKVFSQFPNYLPLEKGGGLHLNKLEDPSPKDALFQVWLMYVRSLSLSPSLSPFNKVVCIYFTFGKVRWQGYPLNSNFFSLTQDVFSIFSHTTFHNWML